MGLRGCTAVLLVLLFSLGAALLTRMWQQEDGAKFVGRSTMKAVHYPLYGLPDEALLMEDIPMPNFRSWEILVEVYAASINPADYKMMQGAFYLIDFALTHRPGMDVAGKVVAVGSGCTHLKVGDMVHGMAWPHKTGSLAEYFVIDESAVNVIPQGLTLPEAAALPLVSLTSYNSLRTLGNVRNGSRVLILGGSSSTGLMALQLAKAYGAAEIVTTCSPRNNELVTSLGASDVINYRENDVFDVMRKAGRQFDIIYDTIGAGKAVWDGASDGALAAGGQFITITGDVQRTLDIRDLLERGYQITTRKLYAFFMLQRGGYHQYTQPGGSREDLIHLDSLVQRGELKPIIDRTYDFDLEQIKEAFKFLMAGHASGKVVITVKQ